MDIRAFINRYKKIIENFFSISLLNAISHLISFFIIPYLVSVLGFEMYGAYFFMYTIAMYIKLFGMYGFYLSVTRLVSIHRDDKERINEIFNATLFSRILLTAVASVIVGVAVFALMEKDDILMFLFSLGIVFGDVFIPTWLFQGMEEMRYVTVVNASEEPVTLNLPWAPESAEDLLTGRTIPAKAGKLPLALPPYGGLLLK